MLRLVSEIMIEGDDTWLFTAVNEVNIVQDIESLTDTCELKLPKKIKWQNALEKNFKPPVKRGDKITVKLGYDDKLVTRFSGFIRSIDAKVPIVIIFAATPIPATTTSPYCTARLLHRTMAAPIRI